MNGRYVLLVGIGEFTPHIPIVSLDIGVERRDDGYR